MLRVEELPILCQGLPLMKLKWWLILKEYYYPNALRLIHLPPPKIFHMLGFQSALGTLLHRRPCCYLLQMKMVRVSIKSTLKSVFGVYIAPPLIFLTSSTIVNTLLGHFGDVEVTCFLCAGDMPGLRLSGLLEGLANSIFGAKKLRDRGWLIRF